MVDKYSTRWCIEVFFKETKQLLNLGKNQSTNFDVHVAQTTITMIQYQILSLKHRLKANQTIGGIFREIKQDVIKNKLNERIITVISEILTVLEYLVYGEIEYRFPLQKEKDTFGGVLFVNSTSASNRSAGIDLFQYLDLGYGAGLRIMINKKSRANLNIDYAFGFYGASGFYLGINEVY